MSTATAVTTPTVSAFVPREITRVERLTEDSVALSFAAVPGQNLSFTPGQHVTVRHHFDGDEVRRTYSICSLPGSDDLRIGVRRIEQGLMSTWLTEAVGVGDVVEVGPPVGDFGRQRAETPDGHIILVGAGSGVTPLLSIAAHHLERSPSSTVFALLGDRSGSSVMLVEDLAALKDRFTDRLQLVHVLSREQRGVPLLSGRLDTDKIVEIVRRLGDPGAAAHWFLCGPRGMVEAAGAAADELGVTSGRVHRELFFADAPAAAPDAPGDRTATTGTVVVTLNGQSTTLTGDEIGSSILEALLAKRSDAPFACKSGVCGTCRARCISGEVSMNVNYALEQAELAGGMVLTCQARPASDHVELEFL